MARYLIPSKLGLLALVELYTDGIVSTSSTIPILSFILSQLLASSSNAALGHPGRSLWDHFLAKIWKIDSLDALHEFFARLNNLLAKTREEIKKDGELGIPPPAEDMILLSRTSPLGGFVRRAKIEFERLKFGDVLQLWTTFIRWRQESKTYWARRGGVLAKWAGDQVLSEGEEEWGLEETENLAQIAYGGLEDDGYAGSISTDDVEKLLEFHVEQMRGSYEEATERLENLDSNALRSWKANQYWLRYRGILRLKHDLHTNNLEGAEARLIPSLWAAMGAVVNILIALNEFQAARQILIAVIPRALECESCILSAQLYSSLADSYMGIAGQEAAGSLKRTENLTKCLDFLDRAFREYSAVKDINGQCEMRAKKATVMMVVGDKVLANDYASSFLDLKRQRVATTL
ncbi:anaphase-promoting complex subunit 5 protein [Rutstroemia sp. NJR-2017a BBW]|nr:anaphase-promoting complex subunit 5 protein [Rutstroemia sp. NJR-2017a BBW]